LASIGNTHKALIFIPDISGFTRFINETEIDHSQHIIQELLEIIIDANQIKLQVNEVEGDAVLFYKPGELPAMYSILQQVETMFVDFHQNLFKYERDRICECGACSTASGLSLKFIVHAGDIHEINIKDHKKLIGPSVILSHSLLKNSIATSEYVLLSDELFNSDSIKNTEKPAEWDGWRSGTDQYAEFGEVNYKYHSLNFLQKRIVLKPRPKLGERSTNIISVSVDIDAPIERVHFALTDLDIKSKVTEGITDVQYDKAKIPRVGTVHHCILPSVDLEIQATDNTHVDGVRLYAEKVNNLPIFKTANLVYTMEDTRNNTHLNLDVHLPDNSILSNVKFFFYKFFVKKQFLKTMRKLKSFAENK